MSLEVSGEHLAPERGPIYVPTSADGHWAANGRCEEGTFKWEKETDLCSLEGQRSSGRVSGR